MITVDTPAALDQALLPARGTGRIGFVPTMGNLHEGHLTLVREARARADHVVVSIFVNPLQFGDGEDFAGYPRTLEQDSRLLAKEGVDTLFAPSVTAMYPRPRAELTRVEVPLISNLLCGSSRPGHFAGVATVVARLFNLVRPDVAFFGQKDYQQLMVIRRMTEDLAFPIEVVGVPTVREDDGLAMSSRNGYLTPDERDQAPALYAALQAAAVALADGATPDAAEQTCRAWIEAAGLHTDYVAVRRQQDLLMPQPDDRDLVILVAAWLGKARLIDNLEVSR